MRSRQDSLIVRTNRSAWAFRFGECGGSLTDSMPFVARIWTNSAVNKGSRSWIRYRFLFRIPSTASVRFLPTWLIHSLFGFSAIPPISTLRVDNSMKNSTIKRCRPRRVQTSMVKKSAATICSQWRFRNSFHVVLHSRSGAGSIPCLWRMLATVPRAMQYPRFESAPRIRRYPQSRFSFAIRTTKDSIVAAVRGRPGPRCAVPSYFSAISLRCHFRSVSGVTIPATSLRIRRHSRFALRGQAPTLIVGEAKAPVAQLLPEHAILLAQVVDCELLLLVHPSGHSDQQKPERVENSRHLEPALSQASQFFGLYDLRYQTPNYPFSASAVFA